MPKNHHSSLPFFSQINNLAMPVTINDPVGSQTAIGTKPAASIMELKNIVRELTARGTNVSTILTAVGSGKPNPHSWRYDSHCAVC